MSEQTKRSVENITNEMEAIQQDASSVSTEFDQFSESLHSSVQQTTLSIETTDKIMTHIDEINESIQTIATFTDKEAQHTKEISHRTSKLSEYFENTKQLTIQTGSSVHTAGAEVNNIRLEAPKSINSLTPKQQNRVNETRNKVMNWFEHNKKNEF